MSLQTIVLDNLDGELFSHLAELAHANHITVEEQTALVLKESLWKKERTDRVAVLQSIAAMTPKGVVQTDSVILLREDRER